MKNGYIALLDSGVGGLSVLKELKKVMPYEKYLYFGDNCNAPYGNLSKNSLIELTINNVNAMRDIDLKAIVFACNTLSVNVLDTVRKYCDVPLFGVYPPINVSDKERSLCICTCATALDYKKRVGENTAVYPLKDFAKAIEDNVFNLHNLDLNKYIPFRKGIFDVVILGCTHYSLIKNEISDHLKPRKILRGEVFTANFIKNYLVKTKSLVNYYQNDTLFFGDCKNKNKLTWQMWSKTREI